MKLSDIRHIVYILLILLSFGCAGPRSEVEVYHLRDMIREGRVEYLSSLISALGVRDEHVRAAAIRALGELGEVAEPRLKQTVRDNTRRSGPALLALGFGGSPESLAFIRSYQDKEVVGAPAREAEREIERRLYARVTQGQLDAMEAYLEAFPDTARADEARKLRRSKLARSAFEQLSTAPTTDGLKEYLELYSDTEDAPMARVMLARLLIKEARGRIELEEYTEARALLENVSEYDRRREPEARRLSAQSHLMEGKTLRASGKNDEALAALEAASQFPEFRLESERLMADILMSQARAHLEAHNVRDGILRIDRAQQLDPARRKEVATIKSELSMDFQAKLESDDPVERRLALVGLISLGDYASRPMTLYLGNLFAKKDFGAVEEVVVALSDARRSEIDAPPNPGVKHVSELLTDYLRTALQASTGEITRLFSSSEFRQYWNNHLDPIDPRQYPLIFKVEELSVKHMGLSRVGLAMKALLGQDAVDVVNGTLLTEDEVRERLNQGEIGDDSNAPLLARVQLCSSYSQLLGEFRRSVDKDPAQFMKYVVSLTVPPLSSSDWIQVAEGFAGMLERVAAGERTPKLLTREGLSSGRVVLVAPPDYDHRSLTVQVYDPVVDQLSTGDEAVRKEALDRTVALLLNSARIAFGLYAGIDRYTCLMGSTEIPMSSVSQVRGGRFDPETRMLLSRKTYSSIDWEKVRALNGVYGEREIALADIAWARWKQ